MFFSSVKKSNIRKHCPENTTRIIFISYVFFDQSSDKGKVP